jgi:hypothetical protein
MMAKTIRCPYCSAKLRISEKTAGKKLKCLKCRVNFTESPRTTQFTCSQCGANYEVGSDLAGKVIRCRDCHDIQRVQTCPAVLPAASEVSVQRPPIQSPSIIEKVGSVPEPEPRMPRLKKYEEYHEPRMERKRNCADERIRSNFMVVTPAGEESAEEPRVGFRCPFCQSTKKPKVTKKTTAFGWVWFAVLLVGCIPICWVPLLLVTKKHHSCSQCGIELG